MASVFHSRRVYCSFHEFFATGTSSSRERAYKGLGMIDQSSSNIQVVKLESAESAQHGVQTILLSTGETSSRPDPSFVFGPGIDEELTRYRSETHIWPISVHIVRDIEVIGPWFSVGVLLKRDNVTFGSDRLYQDSGSTAAREKLVLQQQELVAGTRRLRKIPGQSVLIATNGHEIYGHWPVDFLPKLYLLKLSGIDMDAAKILLPTNMPAFGRSYLKILGYKEDNIISYNPDRETLLAEELVIPTLARTHSRAAALFADCIAYLNERIDFHHPDLPTSHERRVFLSRRLSKRLGRPLLNFEFAEAAADRAGFAIVHPEQHSLLQQISMFRGAREIVGQYGSALHGSIFSGPGVVMAALQGTGPASAGFLQSGIAERIGQSVGYVFGQSVAAPAPFTPFTIAADDLEACLRTHFA